jgi:hypothetical protein
MINIHSLPTSDGNYNESEHDMFPGLREESLQEFQEFFAARHDIPT